MRQSHRATPRLYSGLEAVGLTPANVTTLMAPASSNASTVSILAHDEQAFLTALNLPGQAAGTAGFDLAADGIQGLVARIRVFVQPLIRGLDTLRGHMRTILESIFTLLSRPRAGPEMVDLRGAGGNRLDTEDLGLSALTASRLEIWDLVLRSRGEDWPAIPIAEPDAAWLNRLETPDRGCFVVALMAMTLLEVRPNQRLPGRIPVRRRKTRV